MDRTEALMAEYNVINEELSRIYTKRAVLISEVLSMNTPEDLLRKHGFTFGQRLVLDVEFHRYVSIIKHVWLDEGAYLAYIDGMRMDDTLRVHVLVNIHAVKRREDGEWMSDALRRKGSISMDIPLELALRMKGVKDVDN